MLNNIPLSSKLILILVAPVLGFIWFASLYVAESFSTFRQMEDTVGASASAQQVSDLITALQRERGASGVYLGSQGRSMQDRLPVLRQAADEAASAVQLNTVRRDEPLEKAMLALNELQGIRAQVDDLALTSLESGARYSEVIKSLIGFTHTLEAKVENAAIARTLGALNQLIET